MIIIILKILTHNLLAVLRVQIPVNKMLTHNWFRFRGFWSSRIATFSDPDAPADSTAPDLPHDDAEKDSAESETYGDLPAPVQEP